MTECDHGSLARSCDRCDMLAEIAELRRKRDGLIHALEAHRLYASVLCKAVDAATDFAGTVAGGASWWDDVWPDHSAALGLARERLTLATGGER